MWGGTGKKPNRTNSKFGTAKSKSTFTGFVVNGTAVEVYFSPKDGLAGQVQSLINSVDHEMAFGMYTFTDNTAANSMLSKIRGGVSAFGILDSNSISYAPWITLSQPSNMGANIKMYQGGIKSVYHHKMFISDPWHPAADPLVSTGSFNWTFSAENSNDENMVVVHDANITNQYYQSFCQSFHDLGGNSCSANMGIPEHLIPETDFVLYPNPCRDRLTIRISGPQKSWGVKVYNALGQLIWEDHFFNMQETDIHLAELSSGIYQVQIISEAGGVKSIKLMKE